MNREERSDFHISMLVAFLIGFCLALITCEITTVIDEQATVPEKVHTPRPQFGTLPPGCGHLYNVDRSDDWATCMGVGKRLVTMYRRDL